MAGLRQRKKARMRRHLSDVATQLFYERGFDQVTVAEVARAADVAENTVFNYFPTKEDLFFDRAGDVEDHYSRALRERSADQSLVDALRDDFLARLEPGNDASLTLGSNKFWSTVDTSSALQARLLAIGQRATERVSLTLADELGYAADDPVPRALASLLLSVPWALQLEVRRRLREGRSNDAAIEPVRAAAVAAFRLLEAGVGSLGRRK